MKDYVSKTLCHRFISFPFLIGAWLRHMFSDSSFGHLPIAASSPRVVHFLVSVLVLLLKGERACMVSTLMPHMLESVEKPSIAILYVTLLWLFATF